MQIQPSSKSFQVGDLVLKWDKAHEEKGKTYQIPENVAWTISDCEQIGPSTFILQDLSGKRDSLPVNGLILKWKP
jgi:hypothetical protein